MSKKKRLVVIACVVMLLIVVGVSMAGCGNKMWVEFNNDYNKAYLKIGDEWKDVEILAWQDYEGEQILIELADNTLMLVSSINVILYRGTLPK